MITSNKQEGGDGSTNIQAHSITIINGITRQEAKDIALDIFRENFLTLKKEAAQTANSRAEKFTDAVLNELMGKEPQTIQKLNDPAIQDALFSAQKTCAKSGDPDVEKLLVDLLVDRIDAPQKSIHEIILDEAISKVSKLSTEHLDSMVICFLIGHSRILNIRNIDDFKNHLNFNFNPFLEHFMTEESFYRHMEYLGCCTMRQEESSIDNFFAGNYFFFQNGFTRSQFVAESSLSFEDFHSFFTKCIYDREKWQFDLIEDWDLKLSTIELPDLQKKKIALFVTRWLKTPEECRALLIEWNPKLKKIVDVWNRSIIRRARLTSVGVALVQAYYKVKTKSTFDISTWVTY